MSLVKNGETARERDVKKKKERMTEFVLVFQEIKREKEKRNERH